MRWVIAAACLCACDSVFGLSGRVQPDAPRDDASPIADGQTSDGPPPPHDEDGDGFDDLADNCPGQANTGQDDSDGDGIGDICDPLDEPTKPNQRLLFDPFVTLESTWTPNTEWTAASDSVGPEPNQPHPDGFRLTHKVVELAASKRWQIDVGIELPPTTTPLVQLVGIHPTNIGSQSLWTCAVYYDGEWKVTAGGTAVPTAISSAPSVTVLRTIGNGASADTTACVVVGGGRATADLNSIPYPMLPQIFGQIAVRYTFVDVIQ